MNSATPPRFALIGAAGFVAPRHLRAIRDVGGKLVAALDPHDAVGVLDRFDRETEFFTNEHAFERHLERLRMNGTPVDWVTVCSPNYLHFSHVKMGLWCGARVICEKPLVVNPDNLDRLAEIEASYKEARDDHRVFTVLQLRHVETLKALREEARTWPPSREVDLHYVTPRGRWYDRSWKGQVDKSGGLTTNIGIHMFDLLLWLFGSLTGVGASDLGARAATGILRFEHANVLWRLSLDGTFPERTLSSQGKTWSITGFEDLHTTVYQETLAGRGHTIEDARPAVELAASLR